MHDPAVGGNGRELAKAADQLSVITGLLGLVLPALSTVSSRGEWKALADAVGDRRQLVSFDWPGFGDSDRPAMPYDAALLRSALRAVLSYLRTTTRQRPSVVAAGHSASMALGLTTEWLARGRSCCWWPPPGAAPCRR